MERAFSFPAGSAAVKTRINRLRGERQMGRDYRDRSGRRKPLLEPRLLRREQRAMRRLKAEPFGSSSNGRARSQPPPRSPRGPPARSPQAVPPPSAPRGAAPAPGSAGSGWTERRSRTADPASRPRTLDPQPGPAASPSPAAFRGRRAGNGGKGEEPAPAPPPPRPRPPARLNEEAIKVDK